MFWTNVRGESLGVLTRLGLATKAEATSAHEEHARTFNRICHAVHNSQDVSVRAIQSAQSSLSNIQAFGIAESLRNRDVMMDHINLVTGKGVEDITLQLDSIFRNLGASIKPELSAIRREVQHLRENFSNDWQKKETEATGETRYPAWRIDDDPSPPRAVDGVRGLRRDATHIAQSGSQGQETTPSDSSLVIALGVGLEVSVMNLFKITKLAIFALLGYLERLSRLWPQLIFVLRILRHIPRSMPNLRSDNIRFIDVLGRRHSLQFEQFRYWEVFETNLQCAFKGLPGADRVSKGDYRIMNPNLRNTILSATNWTQQILPASSLVMSVLVDSVPTWIGLCPRCDSELKTTSGAASCPSCALGLFREGAMAAIRYETSSAMPSQSVEPDRLGKAVGHAAMGLKARRLPEEYSKRDDISCFQRIHLPSELDVDEFLSHTFLHSPRSVGRVAIVGAGMLAEYIANFIQAQTSNQLIILSSLVSSLRCLLVGLLLICNSPDQI